MKKLEESEYKVIQLCEAREYIMSEFSDLDLQNIFIENERKVELQRRNDRVERIK
jgi:hypothetical protein